MNVTESVDTAAESVTPLRLTWQRLMRSAGPHAAALRRSCTASSKAFFRKTPSNTLFHITITTSRRLMFRRGISLSKKMLLSTMK